MHGTFGPAPGLALRGPVLAEAATIVPIMEDSFEIIGTGKAGELTVCPGNPSEHVSRLTEIDFVMKDGVIVRRSKRDAG
jgi:hypothetical protein